jgi:serine/threonine-protein kinase RIO1
LETFWLYRHHWAPLAWAFIQTMHTIHAQDMKHYDLSPFNILLHALIDYQKIFINLANLGLACDQHDHQQPSN